MNAVVRALSAPPGGRSRTLLLGAALLLLPLATAFLVLRLSGVDLSVPFLYNGRDEIWQLVLSKMALDTGWVLTNPFLGAPDVAHWHNNAAAQTSAIHSVIMGGLGLVLGDAVRTQQVYFLLNFPLIALTGYVAARALRVPALLSAVIGFTFAFVPYRFNGVIYAYLANFFVVPLTVLPAIWIMTGRMGPSDDAAGGGAGRRGLLRALRSRPFLASLAIVALVGVSDGYYAFFTLLMIGFAAAVRLLRDGARRPLALLPPAALAAALLAVVLALTAPLRAYQSAHPEEFAPGGRVDTALVKHAFEAEVYSTSIKMMVAPHDRHRVAALAGLGQWMLETSNQARRFATVVWVPLGTLASLLFLLGIVALPAALLGARPAAAAPTGSAPGAAGPWPDRERVANIAAAAGLGVFVTLCAVSGGLGSLVALVYPTIRAYDRFPLVLIFLLYVAAALAVARATRGAGPGMRAARNVGAVAVAVLALADHTPVGTIQRDASIAPRFLAERAFVRLVEADLPEGAMVYQYPHAQYLVNSPYYGWGDFRHVRLYLHSRRLRWSNGAAKNSPVDNWHTRMARQEPEDLVAEMRAAGFRGLVVDRLVVPAEEYARLRDTVTRLTGRPPAENDTASLAYWPLPDPGYRIGRAPDFRAAERIDVADPRAAGSLDLPRSIDRDALLRALAGTPPGAPATVERLDHPEVFQELEEPVRGFGEAPIPLAAFRGGLSCGPGMDGPLSINRDRLVLRVVNGGGFDWTLNTGAFPIQIGLKELTAPDGTRIRWDGGFRATGRLRIGAGETVETEISLQGLDLTTGVPPGTREFVGVFSLMQEGHAWFGSLPGVSECRVRLIP